MQVFLRHLKDAAFLWYEKDADYMAALTSYYAIYAATPLLLVTVSIIGILYGKTFVVDTLHEWGSVLGPGVVDLLHTAVHNLGLLSDEYRFPVFGVLFFSWMVIVMLNSFTTGLHYLYGVSHAGLRGWLRKCGHSVLFIVVLEIYLLFLFGLSEFIEYLVDVTGSMVVLVIQYFFFIITTALLFSFAYYVLPWIVPPLRARLVGGFVASILFTIAKHLVVFYVHGTPTPGLYEAAGNFIILLIWLYVTSCIMYYGAAVAYVLGERTNTNTCRYGCR